MERKYSVAEIEQMRMLTMDIYGITWHSGCSSEQVEAMLQTYMKNGTDPEEMKVEYRALRKKAYPNDPSQW